MEMRACEETGMSQDLTPPIPPIAASLHDPYLRSHCSSCFRSITTPDPPTSCPVCHTSLFYCSPRCSHADSHRHHSSGECRLLRYLLPSTSRPGDTADLRAALRLLYSLDRLGFLPPPRTDLTPPPRRLGGLLAGGIEEVMGGGDEMAERIREEGLLMSRARGAERAQDDPDGVSLEEAALWAVLTNAVEVQVSEEGAIGIAVYGPQFSWFNHSCLPNACFRFELSSRPEPPLCFSNPGRLGVMPAAAGKEETAAAVWEEWSHAESKLNHGVCHYGPMIVVRSIKPITKGEEVCITYTDLLQPKAVRHLDLWSKYQFVCCCERCDASPPMHLDYILSCNARNSNSDQSSQINTVCEELAECLDQAVARYISDGNPEACCDELESLLCESFQDENFQAEEQPRRKFKLQPLHYLSLSAYMALASAYRTRESNYLSTGLGEENISEAFKMGRAAVAYSLLLAGATDHLLLSESSLIASVALFCTSTGESILGLVRNSIQGSSNKTIETEFCLVSDHSQWTIREGSSSVSWDEFKAASMRFLECLSSILVKSWPFLVQGFPYLESIRSPVNFSWLGISTIRPHVLSSGLTANNFGEHMCFQCSYTSRICIEEDIWGLIQLAVHCLLYGRYLATICYGSECHLAEHAKNLLNGVNYLYVSICSGD